MLTESRTVYDGHIIMTSEPCEVIVTIDGREVARTHRAIRFEEGARPAILYIPAADVDAAAFAPSDHGTTCRWKGEARYRHFTAGERTVENVLWAYPGAREEVAPIRDCVSFDLSHAVVRLEN